MPRTNERGNPLEGLSTTLLVKLGSIVVHADEATSAGASRLDWAAIRGLLDDPEVQTWIEAMNGLALLPVKRDA